jgi:hypothetical protein
MSGARFYFPILLAASFLASCASVPLDGEFTDRELLAAACPAGFSRRVTGSVWTKIESPEMSGQFPATVLADYPKKLAVEVTNLIGAPQAWLVVEAGKTVLKFTAANEKEYGKAPPIRDRLGGLPLELAPRIFAGGVPCPSEDKNQDVRVRQVGEGGLEVVTFNLRTHSTTRYVYFFAKYGGRPWVKEVRWENGVRSGKPEVKSNLMTLLREDPRDSDSAPRRWSASSNQGKIDVRWKDRQTRENSVKAE